MTEHFEAIARFDADIAVAKGADEAFAARPGRAEVAEAAPRLRVRDGSLRRPHDDLEPLRATVADRDD